MRAVNVEGDPDHPVNEGSLCAKGASIWQLAENDRRPDSVLYRAPYSKEFKKVSLAWALERIAHNVKKTRDETFTLKNAKGQVVNRCDGIGLRRFGRSRQRGVLGLPDNAPQPRPGVHRASGTYLTQRNCCGSGRVVRTRRDDQSLDRHPEL